MENNKNTPNAIATTTERIEYLRRAIIERRTLAADFRALAIGATDGRGAIYLNDAIVCESVAEGYERALLVLFP